MDGSYVFKGGKIYKVRVDLCIRPHFSAHPRPHIYTYTQPHPSQHTHTHTSTHTLHPYTQTTTSTTNKPQVPATLDEALMTSLIGLFEKRRFRNFLSYLAKYDEKDPNTYGGTKIV